MPTAGSLVPVCDIPVRLDTYRGCSHNCRYCRTSISRTQLKPGEQGDGPKAVENWVKGDRNAMTRWADWDIPLHWGGMADPFPPEEPLKQRSLPVMKVLANAGYPVVMSIKGTTVLARPEYRAALRDMRCVLQVSMQCSQMDAQEPGAPPYEQRLSDIEALRADVLRTIIRVQPYHPALFDRILLEIPRWRDAGVYGFIVEAMGIRKPTGSLKGFERRGATLMVASAIMRRDFQILKDAAHANGLRIFGGSEPCRNMGDSLSCCGIEGLEGFRGNTANLNYFLFDKQHYTFSEAMKQPGSAMWVSSWNVPNPGRVTATYEQVMRIFEQRAAGIYTLGRV